MIILRQNTPFPQCGLTDFHHADHFLNCATELVHTGCNQESYRKHIYTTLSASYKLSANGKRNRENVREKERGSIDKYETLIGLQKSAATVPAPLQTHLRQNKQTFNAPAILQNP